MRSPGTLRWISALGSRSATSDGHPRPPSRSERVRDRPGRVDGDPRGTPADLVARAVDEEASRREPLLDTGPGSRHLGLLVLSQHVEGTDDGGPSPITERYLEATPSEGQAVTLQRFGRRDAIGIDLDADYLGRRASAGASGRAARRR